MISFTSLFAQERGKASFYSDRMHGRHMANGDKYHKDSLTCAHRSLPFGTLLKVTNLSNNKSVVVEVSDRGPFVRGRIIDLSYTAAKKIGMLSQGIAKVEIVEVPMNRIPYKLDPNCGLEDVIFLMPYEYGISFLDYPETLGDDIEFEEVPVNVPYKRKYLKRKD